MTAGMGGQLQGSKVLVTGADGFIGSHLVEALLGAGTEVRALCQYNSFGSTGWLEDSVPFREASESRRAEVVLGDVRDAELVSSAVDGVDCVVHLAALIAIPYSYVAPRSYVETNVGGTLNVLEAVRRHGTPRMVHTSTSEVYGTPDSVPITESHPLRGQSPYSASKIGADKMCESYALSFGTPVMTLRPFNTYGPRQSARAVIPTVLSQMLGGAEEIRLGATSPRRDFTYVDDTCAGFLRAIEADTEPGETVQLGTGVTVSIGELVELCREVTRSQARVITEEERIRPQGSEVEVLLSDPSLARQRLGWQPRMELREGLSRTADWLSDRVDPGAASRYHR